jgi:hypothetical protein
VINSNLKDIKNNYNFTNNINNNINKMSFIHNQSNLNNYENSNGNFFLNDNIRNDTLYEKRKKIIGNDLINIVWLENPYLDFDSNLIMSGAILMYIVIYPFSNTKFLIKFKFNKNSKIKIKEKLLNYFTDEIMIDSEFVSQYLFNKIILLNLMIKYSLDNTIYKRIELDLYFNNIPDPNPNKPYFETNLTMRNQIIKNIIKKNF